MCGIVGFFGGLAGGAEQAAYKMADCLAHRGPDDQGVWSADDAPVHFAHRRLAILDLSPAGRQPMRSPSGRYTIVYNGEIYNHREIRNDIASAGIAFAGTSDTETLLAAIETVGVSETLNRCNGMFAFALWDSQEQVLTLARDRVGIKPLYYGYNGSQFLFGSELSALEAFPGFSAEIDRNAVALLMRHSYVPTPYSIYHGIFKLPAGSYLSLSRESLEMQAPISPFPDSGPLTPQSFWSVARAFEVGRAEPFQGSLSDAVEQLEALLKSSISFRMLSDVPLGAFLSGGIDSSTVVALMQAQSSSKIKSFSIGFSLDEFNEAHHASAIAAHLGTDHTELYVSEADVLNVVPLLPQLFSEPFGDSSQIPTYLVSKLAREHVTVSLSGDGGDELFTGYRRYFWIQKLWSYFSRIPRPMRHFSGSVLGCVPQQWIDGSYRLLEPMLPSSVRVSRLGQKWSTLAEIMKMKTREELYHRLVSQGSGVYNLVPGAGKVDTILEDYLQRGRSVETLVSMPAADIPSYLVDDILVKVDRASMAVSLEARVPILDHRVVEFSLSLPSHLKVQAGIGKLPLRGVLRKYVPDSLVNRPKMGFGVPLNAWLAGPLKDWAEALLDESLVKRQGYLNSEMVRSLWTDQATGKRLRPHFLWNILMFQSWLQERT